MANLSIRHLLALLVVIAAFIVALAGNSLGLGTPTVLAAMIGVLAVAVLLIPGP